MIYPLRFKDCYCRNASPFSQGVFLLPTCPTEQVGGSRLFEGLCSCCWWLLEVLPQSVPCPLWVAGGRVSFDRLLAKRGRGLLRWSPIDWYGPGVRQDILTVLRLVGFPQSILPLLQNSALSTEFSDPWHLEGQERRGLFHYVSHAVLMVRQPSGTHCFGSPPPSSSCFQLIFCKV